MSKELREAAQLAYDSPPARGWESGRDDDIEKVLRAYLTEHRADDDEMVTVEWLLSVGFKWHENDPNDYLWINNSKFNKFDLIYLPYTLVWLLADECNELALSIKTRGDVRRLAKGLKIDLGE